MNETTLYLNEFKNGLYKQMVDAWERSDKIGDGTVESAAKIRALSDKVDFLTAMIASIESLIQDHSARESVCNELKSGLNEKLIMGEDRKIRTRLFPEQAEFLEEMFKILLI